MRVFYAGNFEWPSEQARAIQTVHTGHALARAGIDVCLVTMRPESPAISPEAALKPYGLPPHPKFSARSVPIIRVPATLNFIEIHKRLAITNFSYCLGAALTLIQMKRIQPVDWVYTRDPRVAWTFIKLRPLTGVRVVYEVHELFGTRPRDNQSLDQSKQWGVANRTRGLEQCVLRGADSLITLTEACRQLIVHEHEIVQERVHTVPDGTRLAIDDDTTERRDRSIFYVGQLYRWKGVDTLIEALRDVPDATLTIIGSGERRGGRDVDRERLEQISATARVADRVTFHDFVPYERVPRYLAQATVAVVPLPDVLMSRYFTSPLKLFDAMASGTPIVASNLESIREVLRDGENAVLVEPDSSDALSAGLRRLLDDREFAHRIAVRARADVSQYTWERRAERIQEVLTDSGTALSVSKRQ